MVNENNIIYFVSFIAFLIISIMFSWVFTRIYIFYILEKYYGKELSNIFKNYKYIFSDKYNKNNTLIKVYSSIKIRHLLKFEKMLINNDDRLYKIGINKYILFLAKYGILFYFLFIFAFIASLLIVFLTIFGYLKN